MKIETKKLNAARLFLFLGRCQQRGKHSISRFDPVVSCFVAGRSMSDYILGYEYEADRAYSDALMQAKDFIRLGCYTPRRKAKLWA